jgi:hypothetical protein
LTKLPAAGSYCFRIPNSALEKILKQFSHICCFSHPPQSINTFTLINPKSSCLSLREILFLPEGNSEEKSTPTHSPSCSQGNRAWGKRWYWVAALWAFPPACFQFRFNLYEQPCVLICILYAGIWFILNFLKICLLKTCLKVGSTFQFPPILTKYQLFSLLLWIATCFGVPLCYAFLWFYSISASSVCKTVKHIQWWFRLKEIVLS